MREVPRPCSIQRRDRNVRCGHDGAIAVRPRSSLRHEGEKALSPFSAAPIIQAPPFLFSHSVHACHRGILSFQLQPPQYYALLQTSYRLRKLRLGTSGFLKYVCLFPLHPQPVGHILCNPWLPAGSTAL